MTATVAAQAAAAAAALPAEASNRVMLTVPR